MESTAQYELNNALEALRRNRGWLIVTGIGMMILGGFAMVHSVAMTIASMWIFGLLMIVGAVISLIAAFRASGWMASIAWGLGAIAYAFAGVIVMMNPLLASGSLTLIFAVAVMISGVSRLWTGFQNRQTGGLWLMIGGAASVVLAVMIISGWPASSFWVFGLLIAVEMLVQGATYLALGLVLGRRP